ncbi:hypothetical protein ACFWTC_34140 [Streptomyces sp. NPDC058619]|uniref:hypothetical protein n=1 Tax=unclassified Streptomyces TaxID=2593676 RepID=UPI003655CFE3
MLPSPGRAAAQKGPLPDLFGAALLTGFIATLALGLVKAPDWGWTSAGTLGGLAAAVLLGVWFILRSARHPAPIVELPLLRVPAFASAAAALTLFTVAFAGMLLGAVLWCQGVWGYSALRTGFAIAPGPLLVPPVALLIGPAVARFGAGRIALTGTVLFAAGILWWAATLDTGSAYATSLLPGMMLTGLGVGMTIPVLTGASAAALPPARFATGSAITSMGRRRGPRHRDPGRHPRHPGPRTRGHRVPAWLVRGRRGIPARRVRDGPAPPQAATGPRQGGRRRRGTEGRRRLRSESRPSMDGRDSHPPKR